MTVRAIIAKDLTSTIAAVQEVTAASMGESSDHSRMVSDIVQQAACLARAIAEDGKGYSVVISPGTYPKVQQLQR